jgi:hypothetical protein
LMAHIAALPSTVWQPAKVSSLPRVVQVGNFIVW